ncbi:DUF2628 domain-containing protein [Sporosarcina sp. E16_3]|uniref:DUF2628 domain-containing protein n=1 Tax=Sporosarcina sp. E16_3 TaxID=2789293 RepID=UPI001A91CBC1|nr:DUF2628 domain-containing protein [Sporosarcina sp. E16_3]MBO0602519.1 DUF2628 domain-containing protein [Sporosarcina sp. E16_3]
MNCTQCGGTIFEKDRFCGACGTSLLDGNVEASSETEKTNLLKVFVGDKKQSYYFGKWEKSEQRSWNWAAFFATFFWLGYRKMYKFVLSILLFFIVVDGVIAILGIDGTRINYYIGIGIAAALGIGGNSEYKKFALREINKLEKQYSEGQLLEKVQKRGGGSWKGFWLTVVFFIGYALLSMIIETAVHSFTKGDSTSIIPEVTFYDSNDKRKTEDVKELDVSLYFPPVGLQRSYLHYGTTGENLISNDEVMSEFDSERNEMFYIHSTGGIANEKVNQYQISEKEIRLVYVINAFKNQEVNEVVIANKDEWKTGDGDDSTSYLTKTGLTVKVPASVFENCIEVVNIVKVGNGVSKIVKYYAPQVGLIKTVFIIEDEEHISQELISSHFLSQNGMQSDDKEDIPNIVNFEKATYVNEEYGFSLDYPSSWTNWLEISYGRWALDAEATIDFVYVNPSKKIEQYVFSILIHDEIFDDSYWENSNGRYITNDGNKTYSLAIASEPNAELLNSENQADLEFVRGMIEELDIIEDTFKFD